MDEPESLNSRSDLKRANRVLEETLERLSVDLARLSPKKLGELGLPEGLHEAVARVQSIASPQARKRQLRLVRSELRDTDWSSIQDRLLRLLEHGSLPGRQPDAAAETSLEATWVSRLVGEGFAGLDAFLGEFPRADRTHLHQLIRSAERSSGERRLKAERKLRDAVRGFLPRP